MTVRIRTDQEPKVSNYLAEHMGEPECAGVYCDRGVGKSGWRQQGDVIGRDDMDGIGSPEDFIDLILDSKARSQGRYRLRANYPDQSAQPQVRFEVQATSSTTRSAPDSVAAGVRDLAVALTRTTESTNARMEGLQERLDRQGANILDKLDTYHQRELQSRDESGGALLSLSVDLAEQRARNAALEVEIDRLRADGRAGFLSAVVDKLPPDQVSGLVGGAVAALPELVAALRGLRVPAPPQLEQQPQPEAPPASGGVGSGPTPTEPTT